MIKISMINKTALISKSLFIFIIIKLIIKVKIYFYENF